jgi:gliding motility-associated-like protein
MNKESFITFFSYLCSSNIQIYMKKVLIMWLLALVLLPTAVWGQKIDGKAYYTDKDNVRQETTNISDGEAPLEVEFRANPTDMGDWTPSYEWHFHLTRNNAGRQELFVRYEEDTNYTFVESGTYNIVLKANMRKGDDIIEDSTTIVITIADSKLEFPNAFSPNDDGYNDYYGAKGVNDPNSPDHWKSIVSFKAIIFNRWGQKLYEWNDPAGRWDGRFHGKVVKDGVYFLHCEAKGADGKDYNIRKDINVLTGFTKKDGSTAGGSE